MTEKPNIIQNHHEWRTCHLPMAKGQLWLLWSSSVWRTFSGMYRPLQLIPRSRNRAIDKSSFCDTMFRQDLQCARPSTSSHLQQWELVQQHRIHKVYGHFENTIRPYDTKMAQGKCGSWTLYATSGESNTDCPCRKWSLATRTVTVFVTV